MRSVTMQDTVTILTVSTVENVLSGQAYMRAPFNCRGYLMAGHSSADVTHELYVDGRALTDANNARTLTAGLLTTPDDVQLSKFFCREGGLMVLKCTNTTGGSQTITYKIVLEECGLEEFEPSELVTQVKLTSLAANTALANALADRRFERPRVDSYLDVYAAASAAGITLELTVGGSRISQPVPISGVNRTPIVPNDLLISGVEVPAGELIEMRFNNTTAGAVFWAYRTVLRETEFVAI